jgi:hypothetical protein
VLAAAHGYSYRYDKYVHFDAWWPHTYN